MFASFASALRQSTRHATRHWPAAIALAGLATGAQAVTWSTIASAGTLDEADTAEVEYSAGQALISNAASAPANAYLRYNIPALGGFKGNKNMLWRVRFRDTGADAQVRLFLRQYKLDGTASSLATFDSNAFSGDDLYQTQTMCTNVTWDFDNGAYYIEAQMSKSADSGGAALGIIELVPGACTP